MSAQIFALVSLYGPWIIAASAFLSCLLVPIPTSLMMLAGGAFVSSGDLDYTCTVLAAFAGAVLGDQAGYRIGRWGGPPFRAWLARHPTRALALSKADALVAQRGGLGVFFSTWLVAPLGPWVNFICGISRMPAWRFTLWDVLGEMVWCTGYITLGYLFAAQVSTVADVMSNVVGLIAALVCLTGFGLWLRAGLKRARAARRDLAN